jgi:diamine N-acetyltransferase
MQLRKLKQKDAVRMYEWMHDTNVVDKLQTDFMSKTMEDCLSFINYGCNQNNIHLAIVDDEDVYMGTVSLKHIKDKKAEFAIVVLKDAMGKGYASWGMKEILKKGFQEYKLDEIYWCVSSDNMRAIKFYDKYEYTRVSAKDIGQIQGYKLEQINNYIWYRIERNIKWEN